LLREVEFVTRGKRYVNCSRSRPIRAVSLNHLLFSYNIMHDMYHSDENCDKGLLGCDYWKTGRQVPTFWRVMVLLRSEHEGSAMLVTVYHYTVPHPQKAVFLILIVPFRRFSLI
jgi:hypothetical protein